MWQYDSFSTEATIGNILYNLINMQIDLRTAKFRVLEFEALEAKVTALQKENELLLTHLGLNPKSKAKKKSPKTG